MSHNGLTDSRPAHPAGADPLSAAHPRFLELPVADGDFTIRESLPSGHKSLHAGKAYSTGDILGSIGIREPLKTPNYLSVQFGEFEHGLLAPEHFQYINHSCAPNIFLDVEAGQMRALRDILPGDELCFFYPSTEWRMDQAFRCHCNSADCLGLIQGAFFLSESVLARYELSGHIRQLKQRGAAA